MSENTIRTFRDLVAWQKGMGLERDVYRITRALPPEERFGLMTQMRRAAVSVPSNIAEGYGRQGRTDYIRFLKTARGSLAELATQYELATSMSLISRDQNTEAMLDEAERVLQGLINSLDRKNS